MEHQKANINPANNNFGVACFMFRISMRSSRRLSFDNAASVRTKINSDFVFMDLKSGKAVSLNWINRPVLQDMRYPEQKWWVVSVQRGFLLASVSLMTRVLVKKMLRFFHIPVRLAMICL